MRKSIFAIVLFGLLGAKHAFAQGQDNFRDLVYRVLLYLLTTLQAKSSADAGE